MKSVPAERWAAVEGLILDCDGVLTNGEIYYDEHGVRSLAFFSRDGLGLAMLCRSGVKVGIISGRPADIAERRHAELGVDTFVGRCRNKAKAVRECAQGWGISPEACAFVGDDLLDLSGFAACGLAIAVADAAQEVRDAAQVVTAAPGGRGAVREVCEAILRAKGQWDRLITTLRG